jgi:hypothetical protein
MKAFNKLAMTVMAAYTVVALTACPGTNNGTNNASTPASPTTCPANGYYTGVNGQQIMCTPGQVINPNNSVCPTSGYYVLNGQNVACTPGQIIPTTTYNPPTGYPYQPSPQQGCSGYYAIYGSIYVPMYLQGQLVCVNYDYLLSQLQLSAQWNSYYMSSYYYQYEEDYYYQYPPYSGGTCGGTSIFLNIGSFSGGACF